MISICIVHRFVFCFVISLWHHTGACLFHVFFVQVNSLQLLSLTEHSRQNKTDDGYYIHNLKAGTNKTEEFIYSS